MPTYYKPTRRVGKRVVYRSTDPEEPKRDLVNLVKFLLAAIIVFAAIGLLFRWSR